MASRTNSPNRRPRRRVGSKTSGSGNYQLVEEKPSIAEQVPNARSFQRSDTIRLMKAERGEGGLTVMGTKFCRVQRTKVKSPQGACLCLPFLDGHCDQGPLCTLVHVPKQYLWKVIEPEIDGGMFRPGFSIRCYTPGMDALYDIPSEYFYVTYGGRRYVELFNDNGDNFKEKCRLCPVMQEKGYCDKGIDCEDVHCCTGDLTPFPCIRTHIVDEEMGQPYECLPEAVTVRAFCKLNNEFQEYPGNVVLRTAGATQYEQAFHESGGITPNMKMQHCVHFREKRMCRLGDGCRFLHVVPAALATHPDDSTRTSPIPAGSSRSTPIQNAPAAQPQNTVAARSNAAEQAIAELMRSMASGTISSPARPNSQDTRNEVNVSPVPSSGVAYTSSAGDFVTTPIAVQSRRMSPLASCVLPPGSSSGRISPTNVRIPARDATAIQSAPLVVSHIKEKAPKDGRHWPY